MPGLNCGSAEPLFKNELWLTAFLTNRDIISAVEPTGFGVVLTLSSQSICRTAVATTVALLLNAWLACAHPLRKAPTSNLDTGEVSQAVQAFHREQQTPNVVLMGSSLMLAPVMQCDANLLSRPIERMTHRRNEFMERQLAEIGKRSRVFCFAIGGAMVSDDYFLAKNFLKGAKKPDAIVFGIAPRDFQDNLLPGVQATETFRAVAAVDDVCDVLKQNELPFEQALNTAIAQLFPAYKYRDDLRVYATLRMKKLMCQALPWVVLDRYGPDRVLRPSRKGQLPEEVKGIPMIAPSVAMLHNERKVTLAEYDRRYNPINEHSVARQFEYLNRMLALCADRNIKVLVVNMPLSKSNLGLLRDGFYKNFKNRLAVACADNHAQLLDLCVPPQMAEQNFVDSVHLDTGEPSDRFLKTLCAHIEDANQPIQIGGL